MEIQKLKAKDLRIGNYVVFNTNEKPFQITPAGLLELSIIEGKPNPYFYESVKITEVILYNLGFVDSDFFKNTYVFGNFAIYLQDNLYWYNLSHDTISFAFVHDLQNLYYGIYKHELEFSVSV